MMEFFGDVQPLLQVNEDAGLQTRKILHILQDPQKKLHVLLHIELAVAVDGGIPLVHATY